MNGWWRAPVRAVLRRWLDLEVDGVEHIPPAGPFILAANHASHADAIALGAAVARPLCFVGDRALASTALLGPLLPRLGFLPIDRGAGDAEVLARLARSLIDEQVGLVVFAEGSRSRDGRVHRPRSGVSRLAAATGVPVVPAGIHGTEHVWPVDARVRLTGSRWTPGAAGAAGGVRVAIGAPLSPPADTPGERRDWSERLHGELVALSGRPRADTFAPVGGGVSAGSPT